MYRKKEKMESDFQFKCKKFDIRLYYLVVSREIFN